MKILRESSSVKSFKQLVEALSHVHSKEDTNEVMGQIDNSFQAERISWKDHEILYELASIVYSAFR